MRSGLRPHRRLQRQARKPRPGRGTRTTHSWCHSWLTLTLCCLDWQRISERFRVMAKREKYGYLHPEDVSDLEIELAMIQLGPEVLAKQGRSLFLHYRNAEALL